MPAYQSENTSLALTPMTAMEWMVSLLRGRMFFSFFSSTTDLSVTNRARALCFRPYQGSSFPVMAL